MALTKKQNIKVSIYITMITMVVSMIAHFFYTPFLLDKIGDSQYGLYGFATSSLSWLTIAVNAILSAYNKIASEEIVKDKEHGESRTNTIYTFIVVVFAGLIAIIASVFLILLATKTVTFKNYNSEDQRTIMILFGIVAIQIVITIATKVATINIQYNNHHVWVKLSTLAITILTPVITIPFILNGHGIIVVVTIIVSLNILSHILDLLFDRFVLKKRYPLIPKKEHFKMLAPIFAFCSIVLLNELAFQLDSSIDNIVLGWKGYSSAITTYTLAHSLVTIAATCSSMIYTPFIPTVFKNEANGRRDLNQNLYDLITFVQMLLWILITGGFISCGKEFVTIWVGNDRIIIYYLCSALFIIRSVSNCSGPSRDMMRAANKHLHRAILAVAITIVNTTLTVLLVNLLPSEQAIWGCVIGTGVASVLGWWIVSQIMNKKYLHVNVLGFVKNYLLTVLIAAIAASLSICVKKFGLSPVIHSNIILFLISGLLFAITYCALMFMLFRKKIIKIYHLLRSK